MERYFLNLLEWILLRYGKSGFEFAIRYHLESNGKYLIIFDQIKLARIDETIALIEYGKELTAVLMKEQGQAQENSPTQVDER